MKTIKKISIVALIVIISFLSSCKINGNEVEKQIENIELFEKKFKYYNEVGYVLKSDWYECNYIKIETNQDNNIEKTSKYIVGKFEFGNDFICTTDELYYETLVITQQKAQNIVIEKNEKIILKGNKIYKICLDDNSKVIQGKEYTQKININFNFNDFYNETKNIIDSIKRSTDEFIHVDVYDYKRLSVTYQEKIDNFNKLITEEYIFDTKMQVIRIVKSIKYVFEDNDNNYEEIYIFSKCDDSNKKSIATPEKFNEELILDEEITNIDF